MMINDRLNTSGVNFLNSSLLPGPSENGLNSKKHGCSPWQRCRICRMCRVIESHRVRGSIQASWRTPGSRGKSSWCSRKCHGLLDFVRFCVLSAFAECYSILFNVTLLDFILRQVGMTGSLTASWGKVGEAPGRGRSRRSAAPRFFEYSKSLLHLWHRDAVFGSFFCYEEFSMFLENAVVLDLWI